MKRSARRGLVIAGVVIAFFAACYVVAYGFSRKNHRLVRYESGCVARGQLEGRGRDLWIWPYRCAELRRFLEPSDGAEVVFGPLIAAEELARGPHRERPSVCSLPIDALGFPTQGVMRPAWCEPIAK